jgi:hypothetical protein
MPTGRLPMHGRRFRTIVYAILGQEKGWRYSENQEILFCAPRAKINALALPYIPQLNS